MGRAPVEPWGQPFTEGPHQEEERERRDTAAEVVDPSYLLPGGDADAEGEVEVEAEVEEPEVYSEHHVQLEDTEAEPIDPLDAL